MNPSLAKHHRLFLFSLCLPPIISCIDMMAVSIAIHPIMRQLSLSLAQAQWIMSAYTIGNAAFIISIGKCADLYGRRKIFCIGILIFMLASLIGAFSHSIFELIVARLLQGVASAALLVSSVAIITANFNVSDRGKIISQWGFALSLGLISGPFVGGLIVAFANWQTIFWVNIPICLLSLLFVKRYIPREKKAIVNTRINWLSVSLLSITLISLLNTLSLLQNNIDTTSFLAGSVALCILPGLLFFKRECSITNPLIDFSLFKMPHFTKPAVCGFISYFCMYGWLVIIGIYLQKNLGMSTLVAGAWCLFFSVGFALSTKINIMILHHYDSKKLLQAGWIIMTASLWLMHFLQNYPILIAMVSLFLLFGISLGMVNTGSMTSALKPIHNEQAGIASGMIFTIRWVGGAIGVVVAAALFSRGGLSTTCLGLFFTCVVSIPLLFFRLEANLPKEF